LSAIAGFLHALAGARQSLSPPPTLEMQMSSRNALAGRDAVSPKATAADPTTTDIIEGAILMRIISAPGLMESLNNL
jgi:hypothetical protein